MSPHKRVWVTAGPLWGHRLEREDFVQPALLRFDGDGFMNDLMRLTALGEPARATALAAKCVTAEKAAGVKLFQPAHGEYTLVAGSLVCQAPCLPDHVVARDERVAFVVRRVDDSGHESAWIPAVGAAADVPQGVWQALADDATVAEGEELLPLFPLSWSDGGVTRRAWAGVVPVSARERYEAVATSARDSASREAGLDDAAVLDAKVFGPLQKFVATPAANSDAATRTTGVWFAILDLADLLERRLGFGAIDNAGGEAAVAARAALRSTAIRAAVSMLHALHAVRAHAAAVLEHGTWPGAAAVTPSAASLSADDLIRLRADLLASLALVSPAIASQDLPVIRESGNRYLVRCVFVRPPCGLRPTHVVSHASPAFRMASFLDLDAPQRATRITLPFDLSLASLRKLKKSVGIVMSSAMRAKQEAANTPLTLAGSAVNVQPAEVGWITIWSIPIITVCATILLLIIATILHMVFWWIPYLRILVPVRTQP